MIAEYERAQIGEAGTDQGRTRITLILEHPFLRDFKSLSGGVLEQGRGLAAARTT